MSIESAPIASGKAIVSGLGVCIVANLAVVHVFLSLVSVDNWSLVRTPSCCDGFVHLHSSVHAVLCRVHESSVIIILVLLLESSTSETNESLSFSSSSWLL